ANGVPPFTVEYFTNTGSGNTVFASAGSSGTPPYQLSLGTPSAGAWNIYAAASDGTESPATANSLTNTFIMAAPLTVTLTHPEDGSTIDYASRVTGTASISGGTAPYSVQFYLDDAANGAPITSSPYSRD